MCEEFESLQDRSGQPDVFMGQSIYLTEIKAEVLLENDIALNQNRLLQRDDKRNCHWTKPVLDENVIG